MCGEHDIMISDNLRAMVIQCVRALASEPTVQIRYFPEFVPVIYELQRDLPDVLSQIANSGIPNILSDAEKNHLTELKTLLSKLNESVTGDSGRSDETILKSSEWTEIRSRANVIIDLNGWQGPLTDELPHKS